MRSALEESDIELFSLLIDDRDLTDAAHVVGELAWMANWIEIAGDLGATHARVIAGKAEPSEEAVEDERARPDAPLLASRLSSFCHEEDA